jgi:hypothetical protein
MTTTRKDVILGALDQAGGEGGGQAYLARQAEENAAAFMARVALLLPVPETAVVRSSSGGTAGERRETQRNGAVASRNGRSAVRRDKSGEPLVISCINTSDKWCADPACP